jgi:uncharacterized protein (DUF1501 family)
MKRRTFLGHAGALAGTAALGQLGALAAHAASASDYKALVCIFLYGGNDTNADPQLPGATPGRALAA